MRLLQPLISLLCGQRGVRGAAAERTTQRCSDTVGGDPVSTHNLLFRHSL